MKYYEFLNLKIEPFKPDIDPIEYIDKRHTYNRVHSISNIPIDALNPVLLDFFESFNLKINHAESFRKKPWPVSSDPHIDLVPSDISKLNWVWGGTGSVMEWRSLKSGRELKSKLTPIYTSYLHADLEDTDVIDSVELKNPTLVQVGCLHSVKNTIDTRYCLAICFIDKETKKRIPMEKAIEIFNEYTLVS